MNPENEWKVSGKRARLLQLSLSPIARTKPLCLFSPSEASRYRASTEDTQRCNEAEFGERHVNDPGNASDSKVEENRYEHHGLIRAIASANRLFTSARVVVGSLL